MALLDVGAVYPSDFETPVKVGFVEVRISLEVIKDLSKQCLSRHDNDSLRPANLMILIRDVLLPKVRNVIKRVQQWNEVSQSLSRSVVGIDNHAKILEIVLKSNGQRFCLHQGGFLVVVILEQVDYLRLDRVVLELGLFALGMQVEFLALLLRIFLHALKYYKE